MSSMKRYLLLAMLAVLAVVVINLATYALQSPQEVDRAEIEKCWEESQDSTRTAEKRRIVIGACHALEKAFQLNYGTNVFPSAKDV